MKKVAAFFVTLFIVSLLTGCFYKEKCAAYNQVETEEVQPDVAD
jgi:hypothetical protein